MTLRTASTKVNVKRATIRECIKLMLTDFEADPNWQLRPEYVDPYLRIMTNRVCNLLFAIKQAEGRHPNCAPVASRTNSISKIFERFEHGSGDGVHLRVRRGDEQSAAVNDHSRQASALEGLRRRNCEEGRQVMGVVTGRTSMGGHFHLREQGRMSTCPPKSAAGRRRRPARAHNANPRPNRSEEEPRPRRSRRDSARPSHNNTAEEVVDQMTTTRHEPAGWRAT